MTITGREIREARALLGWDRSTMARRAALPVTVIERAERNDGEPLITTAQEIAIKNAVVKAGVEFIPGNDAGTGVRLNRIKDDKP